MTVNGPCRAVQRAASLAQARHATTGSADLGTKHTKPCRAWTTPKKSVLRASLLGTLCLDTSNCSIDAKRPSGSRCEGALVKTVVVLFLLTCQRWSGA